MVFWTSSGLGRIPANALAHSDLSQETTAWLRQDLVRKIFAAPLRQLE